MIRSLLPLLVLSVTAACSPGNKTAVTDTIPASSSIAGQGPRDLDEFESFIDSIISSRLKKDNIPGAAFVFVKDGKVFLIKGYGMANIEANKVVDPEKTLFRIGSISKVFTADAILQLTGESRIRLDNDINTYLRKLQVPMTFPQAITPRHILTHTTGLDEIRPGTQGPDSTSVQPLHQFLGNKMVRLWPPGEIIMYSTYGITLGGLLVEEVSKQPFEDYIREHICLPLGMKNTNINVPSHLKENLAMGYEISGGQNIPQNWEWYHTTPASSVNSTAGDMAKWLIAHLNNGKLEDRQLMPEKMMRQMLSHQMGMHDSMYGMTYGFFEEYYGRLRFLYHGGNMAGFNSLVVLIPGKNAGFFFVSQHEGSSLRNDLQWAIMEKYYKDTMKVWAPAPTGNVERAVMFEGQYQYNVYCHTCPKRTNTMKFMIKANADGSIRLNNKNWVETKDQLLFIREDGRSMIAFKADSSGKISHVSFGGYWTFEKIP